MLIYKVTNKINGKSYIGQTVKTFPERKAGHMYRFREGARDYRLYQAFRKYGVDNFEWEVLETCQTKKELDAREQFYVEQFDTYENGYNCTLGGNTLGEESIEKIRQKMIGRKITWKCGGKGLKGEAHPFYGKTGAKSLVSKAYIITEPDGTQHHVKGLREFCRQFKDGSLKHSSFVQVAKGNWTHYKGYKCQYADATFNDQADMP